MSCALLATGIGPQRSGSSWHGDCKTFMTDWVWGGVEGGLKAGATKVRASFFFCVDTVFPLVGTITCEDARGTVPSGKRGIFGAGGCLAAGGAKDGTTDFLRGAIFGFLALTGFTGPEEVVTPVLVDVTPVPFWIVVATFRGEKGVGIGGGAIGKG